MADLNEEQLKRAEARGRKTLETEPRAAAARYDAATGRIVVDLANGCAYAFPARHIQDLHDASGEDLAKIEVDGAGFNLRWPSLDVDLYVPALVDGIFGNRAWMARELARVAGRTNRPRRPPPPAPTAPTAAGHAGRRRADSRSLRSYGG